MPRRYSAGERRENFSGRMWPEKYWHFNGEPDCKTEEVSPTECFAGNPAYERLEP